MTGFCNKTFTSIHVRALSIGISRLHPLMLRTARPIVNILCAGGWHFELNLYLKADPARGVHIQHLQALGGSNLNTARLRCSRTYNAMQGIASGLNR